MASLKPNMESPWGAAPPFWFRVIARRLPLLA